MTKLGRSLLLAVVAVASACRPGLGGLEYPVDEPLTVPHPTARARPKADVLAELGDHLYGVTLDNVEDLANTVPALKQLPRKPTARIVFQDGLAPMDYSNAIPAIHAVSHVMGTFADSSSMAHLSKTAFAKKADTFFATFATSVDIWEVGNEINGNWLGRTSATVAKMVYAYDLVTAGGGVTELTLFACNDADDGEHEMFDWVAANVPERMRTGLDYVLLSYYEGNCTAPRSDWQEVFDRLRTVFPRARLGFGEVGSIDADAADDIHDLTASAALLERYYTMTITTPGYVGGHFWWYFAEDMVPSTKALYGVLSDTWKAAP